MFPIVVLSQQVCQRQSLFIFFCPKISGSPPPGHYYCAVFLRDQGSQLFPGCDGCCLLPCGGETEPRVLYVASSLLYLEAPLILQLARYFFSFSLCIRSWLWCILGLICLVLYVREFDEFSDSVNLYTLLSSGKRVAICGWFLILVFPHLFWALVVWSFDERPKIPWHSAQLFEACFLSVVQIGWLKNKNKNKANPFYLCLQLLSSGLSFLSMNLFGQCIFNFLYSISQSNVYSCFFGVFCVFAQSFVSSIAIKCSVRVLGSILWRLL